MRRRATNLAIHVAFGLVITLLVVLLRCGTMSARQGMKSPSGAVTIGKGPKIVDPVSPGEDVCWYWQLIETTGVTQCASFVMEYELMGSMLGTARRSRDRELPRPFDAPPPPWAACRDPRSFPSNLEIGRIVIEHAYGWPFLCLAERKDQNGSTWDRIDGFELKIPILQRSFGHDGFWPSRIYWPGMLGNILTYSLCTLLVQVLWGSVRARRKRRRIASGACGNCNYNLKGGLNVCPECGTTAPPRPPA